MNPQMDYLQVAKEALVIVVTTAQNLVGREALDFIVPLRMLQPTGEEPVEEANKKQMDTTVIVGLHHLAGQAVLVALLASIAAEMELLVKLFPPYLAITVLQESQRAR